MIVIATGTPRSGTKTMSKFFEAQGWKSYHCRYGEDSAIDAYNVYYKKVDSLSFAKKIYSNMDSVSYYFESDDKYFLLLTDFYKLDDGIKFIILLRDKNEFIRSGVFRKWYQINEDLDIYEKYRLKPPSRIRDVEDKIGWLWAEINRVIFKQLTQIPQKNFLLIHVHEFSNGVSLEKKLEQFLEIPIKKGIFDWSVKYNVNPYTLVMRIMRFMRNLRNKLNLSRAHDA